MEPHRKTVPHGKMWGGLLSACATIRHPNLAAQYTTKFFCAAAARPGFNLTERLQQFPKWTQLWETLPRRSQKSRQATKQRPAKAQRQQAPPWSSTREPSTPPLNGTSTFMSRNKTFVAIRAPPSRQILAASRSSGAPRGPKAPATGKAARWLPGSSKAPPQRQCLGICGSRSLERRMRTTRMQSEGMRSSGGPRATKSRLAWDNKSAREAGTRSEKRFSHAVASKHTVVALCHPRK